MKAFASWVGKRFVLFLALMAAIAIFQSGLLPEACEGGCDPGTLGVWTSAGDLQDSLGTIKDEATSQLGQDFQDFGTWTNERRREALDERKARLKEINSRLKEVPGFFEQYMPGRVIERHKLTLERSVVQQEIKVLTAHVNLDRAKSGAKILVPTEASIGRADKKCEAVNQAIEEFNKLPHHEKWVRNRTGRNDAKILTDDSRRLCNRAADLQKKRDNGLRQARERQKRIEQAEETLRRTQEAARAAIAKVASPEVRNTVADIAMKAALALAAIIAMPYLIRTLFFYVLAPLAQRRPAIRIKLDQDAAADIPLPEGSRVSLSVVPGGDEELLVRQGYLQTSSVAGSKSTRWLLEYRHPLSNLASGLSFLTRIRGEGQATTISATKDGFAELASISLPAGSACVLHPRALAAVVQPLGRPIKIRSHWRLFSLNAWLTMQLRYFSFHGPGQLIVKGGRGIRVERAEMGRIFSQDQLVGFSADLAYSVTRTETFAPYLFGQQPLLKDRVEAGGGILIIEEAPLSSHRSRNGRGLEGMFDAGMKAFGL